MSEQWPKYFNVYTVYSEMLRDKQDYIIQDLLQFEVFI